MRAREKKKYTIMQLPDEANVMLFSWRGRKAEILIDDLMTFFEAFEVSADGTPRLPIPVAEGTTPPATDGEAKGGA